MVGVSSEVRDRGVVIIKCGGVKTRVGNAIIGRYCWRLWPV